MKISFIIAAVLIVGAFVYIGVKQYSNPPKEAETQIQNNMQKDNTVPEEAEGDKIVTPDGLSIQDITFGTGATAETGDKVTVHYVGSLKDGKVFDASTTRGEPFTFTLGSGEVIQGWDLGVEGMKEGGVRELIIPSSLAYGDNAVGPIPAGSELTFLVQLLQVEKK